MGCQTVLVGYNGPAKRIVRANGLARAGTARAVTMI